MRRSDPKPPRRAPSPEYLAELIELAEGHGLSAFGVAPADVLDRSRQEIHRRRAANLHDGMQFTYRNPDRSTDPSRAVAGARSIIVGAMPYLLSDIDAPAADPSGAEQAEVVTVFGRVARYAWRDHHEPLRSGLSAMAQRLRDDGWKATAFADDNSIVDREVAHLAGIGWFGKSSNLLVAGAGSWFVLGCVITTAPFAPAEHVVADGCGSCRRCIDGCPTGAIIGDGVIDASRCLSWLLQKPGIFDPRFRVALGDRIYGCDDCQEVCPPTVHLGKRLQRPASGAEQRLVDVLELLTDDDEAVLATNGRWYLADRDPRWLRRNALVVLGNSACLGVSFAAASTSEASTAETSMELRVRSVLDRYISHHDPVLRAHAVWAARRLGADDLVPVSDPDPMVSAELIRQL